MGYVMLFLWLMILSFCAGGLFCTKKNRISFGGQWLWGQFVLWAVFQIIAVYYILKQGSLEDVIRAYWMIAAVIAVGGLALALKLWMDGYKPVHRKAFSWIKEHKALFFVFVALWLIQMLALLFLAVNDGDDAYYMAIASVAESSGNMYTANVYAFGGTELTYRYALAPFPIWIAFLSKISGVHTLVIGHILLGMMLVTMSYVIYAQIGKVIFGDNFRKRIQMLIWVAVLFIWGNTSSHTAESFLLLRSRQGKALVAGLVFPAMIYLLIKIGHCLEQNRKITFREFLLAAVIILTGCLGSTLGGVLVILLWGSGLLFLAIGYKKWTLLPLGMFSIVPGLVFAVIYLLH